MLFGNRSASLCGGVVHRGPCPGVNRGAGVVWSWNTSVVGEQTTNVLTTVLNAKHHVYLNMNTGEQGVQYWGSSKVMQEQHVVGL